MEKTGNMKHSKAFDLLKMCVKYFCRSTYMYNHVKTDVPKKHIYLASQYNELLAVSVQIYKIRTHLSNIPHDKLSVFIRPFEKRSYYVIPPGVRPSVRPSVNFFVSV